MTSNALAANTTSQQPKGITKSELKQTPQAEKKVETCELSNILDAIAWPLVALSIVLLTLGSRTFVRHFTPIFKTLIRNAKLKSSLLDLEFNAEAAKDVKASIKSDLRSYIDAADIEYEQQVRVHNLSESLATAKKALMEAMGTTDAHLIRATIHVPDVVLKGYLYQLVNYTPGGYGKGRRLSERFGILGRSWRLERSLCTNEALTDSNNQLEREEDLIQFWGMTREEAQGRSALETSSCLCILLREEMTKMRVGVLYLACERANQFTSAVDYKSHLIRQSSKVKAVRSELDTMEAIKDLSKRVVAATKELKRGATYLSFNE
jgi:hypothetical protein